MWTLALWWVASTAHALPARSFATFDDAGRLTAIGCGGEPVSEQHAAWCQGEQPVVLHFPDGTVKARFTMDDGELHGEHTTYRPDGSVQTITTYEHGTKDGTIVDLRADGTRERVRTVVDGRLSGDQITYHPDGQTVARHDVADPEMKPPTVRHETFTEAGVPIRRVVREGDRYEVTTFHPDATPSAVGWFTVPSRCRPNPVCLGHPVAEHILYDRDGEVAERRRYDERGKPIVADASPD